MPSSIEKFEPARNQIEAQEDTQQSGRGSKSKAQRRVLSSANDSKKTEFHKRRSGLRQKMPNQHPL
jgi:hypothetical protein